jgi:hypothetical protein
MAVPRALPQRSVTAAFLPRCGQRPPSALADLSAPRGADLSEASLAGQSEEAVMEAAARALLVGEAEPEVLRLLLQRARFQTPVGLIDLMVRLGSSGTVRP